MKETNLLDKMYIQVEQYLHKQFPKKRIHKCEEINDPKFEIYGFHSIQIKLVESKHDIYYQIISKRLK
jgi:hypothetical protein